MYLPWKRKSVANRWNNLREFEVTIATDAFFRCEDEVEISKVTRVGRFGAATQSLGAMLK
jgi:hypothetical protein